jgi:hypothetical protein
MRLIIVWISAYNVGKSAETSLRNEFTGCSKFAYAMYYLLILNGTWYYE